MHTVDLAVKHGLGILVRKKKKVVVDECVELTKLRTKIKDLCSYVMDKKSKTRFEDLKKISNDIWNCDCSKLEIPNATRVAGFYRMLQSLLRNKHVLENAQKSNSQNLELDKYALTDDEWVAVSQIECVLKKMTTLNMNMQSDIPGKLLSIQMFVQNISFLQCNFYFNIIGRQGLALYEIVVTKAALFSGDNEYNTIDVSKPWRPDTNYDKLPRIKVKDDDFGDVAKTLLERLRKEFDHYLTSLDDDMKVMTIVHPVGAGLGLE
jgi:hypothetical protein